MEKKKEMEFLIQLFGEGEETAPVQETEQGLDEGETQELEDDATDPEFDDGEEAQEKEKPKTKAEQNKEQAQKRIQARKQREEKAKRDIEDANRKGYVEGLKKSLKGVNPYTEKPIEDDFDVKEYETMLEMEQKGLDPIEDYSNYIKEKQREETKKAEEEKAKVEAQNKANYDDVDSFVKKYGKETLTQLQNDQKFLTFANGLVGLAPLTTLYEKFNSMQSEMMQEADKLALEKDARRMSSQGKAGQKATPSPKSFGSMTREEFREYRKKHNMN